MDVARTLADAGIAYAVVGGIAVGIHSAAPRATADIDVVIPTDVARSGVTAALTDAGFEPTGEHAHSLDFRHPSGEPVQVAFDPGFDPMVERAEEVEVGGAPVRLVRRGDLIAMKERAARDPAGFRSKALRDQADVELLKGDVPGPDEGW